MDALAKDLIRRLLTADKTKRIGCLRGGAEDIKNHKWFDRLNWDTVFRCAMPVPFVPKVRAWLRQRASQGILAEQPNCVCVCVCTDCKHFSWQVRGEDDTSNFDDYPDSDTDTALPLSAKDRARFADFDS